MIPSPLKPPAATMTMPATGSGAGDRVAADSGADDGFAAALRRTLAPLVAGTGDTAIGARHRLPTAGADQRTGLAAHDRPAGRPDTNDRRHGAVGTGSSDRADRSRPERNAGVHTPRDSIGAERVRDDIEQPAAIDDRPDLDPRTAATDAADDSTVAADGPAQPAPADEAADTAAAMATDVASAIAAMLATAATATTPALTAAAGATDAVGTDETVAVAAVAAGTTMAGGTAASVVADALAVDASVPALPTPTAMTDATTPVDETATPQSTVTIDDAPIGETGTPAVADDAGTTGEATVLTTAATSADDTTIAGATTGGLGDAADTGSGGDTAPDGGFDSQGRPTTTDALPDQATDTARATIGSGTDTTATTTATAARPGEIAADPTATTAPITTAPVAAATATTPVVDLRGPAPAPAETNRTDAIAAATGRTTVVATTTEPVESVRIAQVLAPEMERMRGTTANRILEIRLDPPDLGGVEVEIRSNGSTISVVAITESADATAAVLRQRDQIEATLRSLGMDLAGFDVSTGDTRRDGADERRTGTSAGATTTTTEGIDDDLAAAPVTTDITEGSVFL
jgi:flagellar hook-length control protein FliK